jgi:hypothetical protein
LFVYPQPPWPTYPWWQQPTWIAGGFTNTGIGTVTSGYIYTLANAGSNSAS